MCMDWSQLHEQGDEAQPIRDGQTTLHPRMMKTIFLNFIDILDWHPFFCSHTWITAYVCANIWYFHDVDMILPWACRMFYGLWHFGIHNWLGITFKGNGVEGFNMHKWNVRGLCYHIFNVCQCLRWPRMCLCQGCAGVCWWKCGINVACLHNYQLHELFS